MVLFVGIVSLIKGGNSDFFLNTLTWITPLANYKLEHASERER